MMGGDDLCCCVAGSWNGEGGSDWGFHVSQNGARARNERRRLGKKRKMEMRMEMIESRIGSMSLKFL